MGRASLHPRRALLVLALGLASAAGTPAHAQGQALVVRDGSLGQGALEVGPGADPLGRPATYLITPGMGEQRGANLFHSFWSFGIGRGETATFTGPDPTDGPQSVSHVISRVTGDEPSQIDGTLRSTIPGADVWLFNPQGVGFGAGAQIDAPGSFHAGSADSVAFEDGGEPFRARAEPEPVLATASPTAFGFLPDGNRAALVVEGGLAVTRGAVEIARGDLALTGAGLEAPGAHLGFEATGQVRIADHTQVDVGGAAPGSVSIRGGRIEIVEGSQLLAENIGAGPGGSLSVWAGESVLVDAGLLSVSARSEGNAGTLRIQGLGDGQPSPDVTFQNNPAGAAWTGAGARAETTGAGAGGEIQIDADELAVRNGMAVSARAIGSAATGDAGRIRITARHLEVEGSDPRRTPEQPYLGLSFISASSNGAPGAPGRVEVAARSVVLLGLAWVATSCESCNSNAVDRREGAATVAITADSLLVKGSGSPTDSNAAVHATSYGGDGDAGRIVLHVRSIRLLDGGGIGVHAGNGHGNDAGDITIDADSIFMSGASRWHSGIFALNEGVSGNAGTITIRTRTLDVQHGANIDGGTGPLAGNAATITIEADAVRIGDLGRPADDDALGRPRIIVRSGSPGNAGTLEIRTRTLELERGGIILAANAGSGKPGKVAITASESIRIDGLGSEPATLLELVSQRKPTPAGIYGISGGAADATALGTVRLVSPEITITNGAIVSTTSIGGGPADEIRLEGDRIHILDGGLVDSSSIFDPIRFVHGGDAGRVTLVGNELIEVRGHHPDVRFDDVGRVTSATLSEGDAGAILLQAPRIVIDEGAVGTTLVPPSLPTSRAPGGGSITLSAGGTGGEVIVRNGGRIDASTFGGGNAGSIQVSASESILVDDSARIESRTGAGGKGGEVALSAPRIEVRGRISAESVVSRIDTIGDLFSSIVRGLYRDPPTDARDVTGNAGSIMLTASHLVHVDGGEITTSVGVARGGDIAIDPVFVILQHGGSITSKALEEDGQGGRIEITTDNFLQFPGSIVSAQGRTPALSGTVEIHSPDVNLAGTLAELPSSFLDASAQMRERCAARRGGERVGSFAVRGAGGIPPEPDGWLRAPVLPDAPALADGPPAPQALVAGVSGLRFPPSGCP